MEEIYDVIHIKGKEFGIDIPVLIIFFARPDVLKQTFELIRRERPSTLLLWQDGPRNNRLDDISKIEKCREIVENIDWNCTLYRFYHAKNMGCDPSTHLSHKWAFTIVDKCIILEDDVIFSETFFPFCKELLDKYENDERIDRICGHNVLGKYKSDISDYFFAKSGNSIGWASWRRVAQKWESDYSFLEDDEALRLLRLAKPDKKSFDRWLKRCKSKAETGVSHWELIVDPETFLYNRLVIYPTVNMIAHIGFGENSTHYVSDIRLLSEKEQANLIERKWNVKFPIRHPKYIVGDIDFMARVTKKYHVPLIMRLFGYLKRRIKKGLLR